MADDVSEPRSRFDPARVSFHAMVACIAAGCSLGLLATWSAGSITRNIQPVLLLTTFFSVATALLGTTLALLNRHHRPVFTTLALFLTCSVVLFIIVTIFQRPPHPLWRAISYLLR